MIFVVDETMYGPRRKPRTFFDFRMYKHDAGVKSVK